MMITIINIGVLETFIFIPRSSVEMIILKIMLIITVIISGVAHGRGRTGVSFPLSAPPNPDGGGGGLP